MARGALQSLSIPHTTDTSSDYRMLLHEVLYSMQYKLYASMDFIVLGCAHLCTGSIQLRMLQMFHTELCNQPKATLCCHRGRTDQGTINYISSGDALCTYFY